MAEYEFAQRVKANADIAWRAVANIGSIPEVSSSLSRLEVLSGEGKGMRWRIHDRSGASWEEECVEWSPGSHFTMRADVSSYPFPLRNLSYSYGIEPRGAGVVIRMTYQYAPRYGALGTLLERTRFGNRFRRHLEDESAQLMEHWVRGIHAQEWAYELNVATILSGKGHDVVSCEPGTQVAEAARMMRNKRIGTVLVVDNGGGILGLVSERDIVRAIGEHGRDVLSYSCAEIMTAPVTVCHPEDNLLNIMSCMSENRLRHLPVVDRNHQLVGMVSIGDVVKTRLTELESESETLRQYIDARRWRERFVELGPSALEEGGMTAGSGLDPEPGR